MFRQHKMISHFKNYRILFKETFEKTLIKDNETHKFYVKVLLVMCY